MLGIAHVAGWSKQHLLAQLSNAKSGTSLAVALRNDLDLVVVLRIFLLVSSHVCMNCFNSQTKKQVQA